MMFLLIAVLSSTGIFVLLRLFAPWRVDALQAIVVNYAVAGFLGWALSGFLMPELTEHRPGWLIPGFFLGFLFIGIFYLMALTARKAGMAVASVATKMSMVLPLLFFGLIIEPGTLSLIGALAALTGVAGVVLSSSGSTDAQRSILAILLPLAVFIGSGFIDIGIALFSGPPFLTDEAELAMFSSAPFAGALFIGLPAMFYRDLRMGKRLNARSILAGALLGIVNYGSIYFLVLAIRSGLFSKSLIIPVVNLGVILVSGFIAVFLMKEQITTKKSIGFALCLIALGMMILSGI
jgi:drug/metabolite transporter (DMT)-like permease